VLAFGTSGSATVTGLGTTSTLERRGSGSSIAAKSGAIALATTAIAWTRIEAISV
jgi:hypothetical protein